MTTAVWVTIVLAGIAVFSVAVKFDLNAFLENRRQEQLARLKAMCPHCILAEEDGNIVIQGLVQSPPSTLQAHCTRCHKVFVGGISEAWGGDSNLEGQPRCAAEGGEAFPTIRKADPAPYARQDVHVQVALADMAYELGVGGLLRLDDFLRLIAHDSIRAAVEDGEGTLWRHQVPHRAESVLELLGAP